MGLLPTTLHEDVKRLWEEKYNHAAMEAIAVKDWQKWGEIETAYKAECREIYRQRKRQAQRISNRLHRKIRRQQ